MAIGRVNNGERMASASAALLFFFTFFDWFGVESSVDSFGFVNVGRSAWEALDCTPIVLVVTIVTTLGVAALRLMRAVPEFPFSLNALVAGFGTISVLLILFRIIDPPTFVSFGTAFETVSAEGTTKVGIFLALLAAVGVVIGGVWAMREEAGLFPSEHQGRQ